MNPSIDHPQGRTQAGRGERPCCGMGMPARIVDRDQFQFRGNSAPVGQPRHISRRSLPRTWPGDLARRPGLFLIRTAGGRCICEQRRADALAPSRLRRPTLIAIHSGWHRQAIARTRWPAVQILRSPCGCALSFQQHASCQGTDALEGHVVASFRGVTFQHRNHDTNRKPKSWKLQPAKSAP